MGPHAQSKPGARLKRASAVVRAWDGPNSRIAFEMDLDQMPWGPFEALGKQVTLLVPEREGREAEAEGRGDGEAAESHLERALRHVEHAAERCAEFAELGNGSDQLWRTSLETWEWLRDFLTTTWMEKGERSETGEGEEEPRSGGGSGEPGGRSSGEAGDGGERAGDGAPDEAAAGAPPSLPDMPGAAATLEMAARALRETPLAVWREAVGTYNPDAPTREEAIRTLRGVAHLLGRATEPARPADRAPASDEPAGDAPTPSHGEAGGEEGGEGMSFDYASGFDEGYRMGRRVGRALGARSRRGPGE